MTEQNGGGIGLLDFDCDLIPDLCIVDSTPFSSENEQTGASRFYRAREACRFEDATYLARFDVVLAGMGVAAGDFDSDGLTDLFIAGFQEQALLHNLGDGTFENVTAHSGLISRHWSTSAAFADLNADGLLDLFVTTYVDWSPDRPPCHSEQNPQLLQICSPAGFNAQPDLFYVNSGAGGFLESGGTAGVSDPVHGKGLALEIADFDENGLLDVFIANDTTPNSLFLNRGMLKFDEAGVQLGVAVSEDGTHGASMGIGCADYDRDGHFDLFVTNFRNQVNDLFGGLGANGFVARNSTTGISTLSLNKLAFGTVFRDFDLDGWPDLFIANGHIWDLTSIDPQAEYQMKADLLWNDRGRVFRDATRNAGAYFNRKWLARAVAAGDLDNDGDYDLVIQNVGDSLVILQNESQRAGSSIRLKFIGVTSAREPLGCRVEILADDSRQTLNVPSGGSFQASHDSRILASLKSANSLMEIRITWPDGQIESWPGMPPDASGQLTLIEGTGVRLRQ